LKKLSIPTTTNGCATSHTTVSKVIKGMVIFALLCFTSVQVLGLENEPLITLASSGVMICFKQGATIEVRNRDAKGLPVCVGANDR